MARLAAAGSPAAVQRFMTPPSVNLTDRQFDRISRMVQDLSGIHLHAKKRRSCRPAWPNACGRWA